MPTYLRNPRACVESLDDEAIMLDLDGGQYHGLNPVAAFIWEELAAEISFDALCQRVLDEFAVDQAQCQKDVSLFLDHLLTKGLIQKR